MKKRIIVGLLLAMALVVAGISCAFAQENFAYNIPIDYKEMTKRVQYFAEAYPDIVSLESMGKSHDNRELWLVKLGTGDVKLHINASVHARERITTNIVLKNIDEYTKAYYAENPNLYGYNVKELLDKVTIYIVPMVNPDGVDYTIYGQHGVHTTSLREDLGSIRKSDTSPIFSGINRWKANINGIDLNRQFPVGWHDALRWDPGVRADSMYKGAKPVSEPESIALYDLQLNNAFMVNATYHTQGSLIYWYKSPDWAVQEKTRSLAASVQNLTGFRSMPIDEPGGGFSDWVIGGTNVPSLTMEFARGAYTDAHFDSIFRPGRALPLLLSQKAIEFHQNAKYEVVVDGTVVKKYDHQGHAQGFIDSYQSLSYADVELIDTRTNNALYARYKEPVEIETEIYLAEVAEEEIAVANQEVKEKKEKESKEKETKEIKTTEKSMNDVDSEAKKMDLNEVNKATVAAFLYKGQKWIPITMFQEMTELDVVVDENTKTITIKEEIYHLEKIKEQWVIPKEVLIDRLAAVRVATKFKGDPTM